MVDGINWNYIKSPIHARKRTLYEKMNINIAEIFLDIRYMFPEVLQNLEANAIAENVDSSDPQSVPTRPCPAPTFELAMHTHTQRQLACIVTTGSPVEHPTLLNTLKCNHQFSSFHDDPNYHVRKHEHSRTLITAY